MNYTKVGSIYRTNNYKMFKTIDGNRTTEHSKIILKSIQKIGYVLNPILVNEKYEIIDGQGRFEALKKMEMPIDYYVVRGIGIAECRQMNIGQKNWGVSDFVNSYAEMKDENYMFLSAFAKQTGWSYECIAYALTGNRSTKPIKDGTISFNAERYNELLSLAKVLAPYNNYPWSENRAKIALIFIFQNCQFDEKRMALTLERIKKLANLNSPASIIDEIQDTYNKQMPEEKRIYLHDAYSKSQDALAISKSGYARKKRKTEKEGD